LSGPPETFEHDLTAYEPYSRVAGELAAPSRDAPYSVGFRRLHGARPVRSFLLVVAALLLIGGFFVWLMLPEHWPVARGDAVADVASILVTVSTGLIGGLLFLNVMALARATLLARDPVPVVPEPGRRLAFVTTIVPQAEPLETVRPTLEAALRIHHDGPFDVWLLDEGDDDEVKRLCAQLGVRHFSRKGVERWNQPRGRHKARSKHGNYNAWLEAHGDDYDFFLSVDPDHVPLPNFAERFLGYFRDPDVAFVVGPQVYGNVDHFVVRAAESQQFVFHSLVQRAGNRSRIPMLVGTNNAVRVDALRSIGGLRDSITEDLATSLELHATRNAATGRRWTSVYTPDVIAVGEGPESFTDYFSQQSRWSRGANRVLMRQFWRRLHALGPRRVVHYALIIYYYPTTALAWMLGAFNGIAYCLFGVNGVRATGANWLILYADVAALQLGLYLYNRRHDVSPHDTEGAPGASGMLLSALSAPVHVVSLLAETLGRNVGFVTTPKGHAGSRDTWRTFRAHLGWSVLFGVPLALSFPLGHDRMALRIWALASLIVCLLPIAVWRAGRRRRPRPARRLEPVARPAPRVSIADARHADAPEAVPRLAGEAA
jgi:hypothetical protein